SPERNSGKFPSEQTSDELGNKPEKKPKENNSEVPDSSKQEVAQAQKQTIPSAPEKPALSMGIMQNPNALNDAMRTKDTTRPASIGRITDDVPKISGTAAELPARLQIHALGPRQNLGFIDNTNNELFEWLGVPTISKSGNPPEVNRQIADKLHAIQQKMRQKQIDKIQVIIGPESTTGQLRELREIAGPQAEAIFAQQAKAVTPTVFTRQIQQKVSPWSLTGNEKKYSEQNTKNPDMEFISPTARPAMSKQEINKPTFVVPSVIRPVRDVSPTHEFLAPNISQVPSTAIENQISRRKFADSQIKSTGWEKPIINAPLIKPLEKIYLSLPNKAPVGLEAQIPNPTHEEQSVFWRKPALLGFQSGSENQVFPMAFPEYFEQESHPSLGNMELMEMPNPNKPELPNYPKPQVFPINILPYRSTKSSTIIPDINHLHLGLHKLPDSMIVPDESVAVNIPAWQENPYFVFPKYDKKETSKAVQSPMSSLIFLASRNKAGKSQEKKLSYSEPQIMRRSISRAAPIQMAPKDRAAGEVMDNTKLSGQEKTVSMLAQAFYSWYQNQEQLSQEQSFRSVGLWR
ncbi:hypothetical protein KAR10_04420, partial [bacterium]|nr:hypothetical protein [bacterium]